MLQRQPQAPATPTVDVRDLPFADQDQEQIRKDARERLPIWAETFANLWYTANNGALGSTAEPEDPDFVSAVGRNAKVAFGLALAGNLIWAATCLTPAGTAVTIAMSFGGATVGSGAIAQITDTPQSSQPSFKVVAAGALAKARDRIAETTRNVVKDVADDCASSKISDAEEQKKRLWAKIFLTAYNQAEPIETAAAAKLAKAAQGFVASWQAHKSSQEVQKEASRRTDERIKKEGYPWSVRLRILWEPSGPGGPADVYWLGIFNEEKIKYAVESFKPALNLG
jgi:hypothetical protein